MQRMESEGGLRIDLPTRWRSLPGGQHLAMFVGPDVDGPFAPSIVINEYPGHLSSAVWWRAARTVTGKGFLVDEQVRDDGFVATVAHDADGIPLTALVRVRHLPGRSVVLTATAATADLHDEEPVLRAALDSLECDGFP